VTTHLVVNLPKISYVDYVIHILRRYASADDGGGDFISVRMTHLWRVLAGLTYGPGLKLSLGNKYLRTEETEIRKQRR
jgi:hypothetical protein